jgi:hypothetical protein
MRNFAVSIVELLGGFSADITTACRRFFKRLKVDESEDESIIFLSKFIIDILNELAKKVAAINKKMEADVVEPLGIYVDSQLKAHAACLHASEQLLHSVQSNNDLLKELGRNFSLNEASLSKTASEKDLLKDIVEGEIDRCNLKWEEIKRAYQQVLEEVDSHNSIRCGFTLRMQISTVRLINRLVNSGALEDSLQDYEESYCPSEALSMEVKDEMR